MEKIPDEIKKQIADETSRKWLLSEDRFNEDQFIDGAEYGYSLASKELQAAKEEIERVVGLGNPFPLKDVLHHLINAAKILLRKKDYDGGDYEDIERCVKRAEEIKNHLNNL